MSGPIEDFIRKMDIQLPEVGKIVKDPDGQHIEVNAGVVYTIGHLAGLFIRGMLDGLSERFPDEDESESKLEPIA